MKYKNRVRTTGLKGQTMAIVVLMITILSAIFLYQIIRYSKKEIRDIAETYDKLIKRSYQVSTIHMSYGYRSVMQPFLAGAAVKSAFAARDRKKLYDLTVPLFHSLEKRFALEEVNWYSMENSLILRVSSSKVYRVPPALVNPVAGKRINNKNKYGDFFIAETGINYRQIFPLFSPDSQGNGAAGMAIGALELVVKTENFLSTIEELLALNIAIIKKETGDNMLTGSESASPTSPWEKIKGGYYFKDINHPGELAHILKQVEVNNVDIQVSYNNKTFKLYPHIDLVDYKGNPAATIISIQDITALKERIDRSIFQIIIITIVILLVVFLILYYRFGKLVGRLAEGETQLKSINKELELEIKARELVEQELTTHRDHLEELMAEGTRELEIKSQEIEANEKKLRTVTSSIRDALVMLDHQGSILFWNPALQRILGYSPEELQGKNFFQHIIPAEDLEKFTRTMAGLGKVKPGQGESYGSGGLGDYGVYGGLIEMECRRKNGEIFPAELMVSEVEIKEKTNLIALLRDITKKKAEETEKRILLRAVEQSSVGIEITDTNGIIEYVNPRFSEITGYRKEEAVGRKTNLLKSDFNPREIYNELWEAITSGNDWHGELYNRKKNGDLYWDSTLISPIKDGMGHITHFIAIKEDITRRKNMEIELLKAKESAEAGSRSKGEFLANMSHEIRTPMNAIIGMTELALGTELNQEQQEYLEIVRQASGSLLKLLNDILDLSKVEAGKLILETAPFSLRGVLADTTKTLAVQAHEKNLELVYYIDSGVPEQLLGDAGRLRQIIVNLVGNSIKFTEEGEIVLKIEVQEEGLEDKVLLHFTVSDTGIGISQDHLAAIFEKFSQADSSTTRKYGGTGLGLAISARLVELMAGVIWAESPSTFIHFNRCGPGSTFHFTALFEVGKEPAEAGKKLELHRLKGLPLLIVDDNETNRRFLQEILARYGLKPEISGSGPEALEILDSKPLDPPYFQLIILDFRMPGMNGRDVLKRIRQELKLAIPVILLTSGVVAEDLSDFTTLDASAHLLKPINSRELLETIMEVMGYKTRENLKKKIAVKEGKTAAGKENLSLRILVAEDNIINQRLIRRLLEKAGHQVEIARDGREAVETFSINAGKPRDKFQLILMDIQMPNMDGIAATREIRKIDKNIPVIALTAHAMKGDKGRFLAQGMDDYVSKPIEKSLLFNIIDKYKPQDV